MRLTAKLNHHHAHPGGASRPAEDEATRVREIRTAASRLGASAGLVAAAVACGVSSANAAAMFAAASQADSAPAPVDDLDSRRRWEADAALRAEFGSFARFAAWARAQAAGRARIAGARTVTGRR